ncbi:PTS sugar transporter subunit IIC [Geoalkalibacter halelectricus]|uniref:PTS sugar transporter subunit IIC n=1 Tax=Geoalkalibacter halelectricus TaxID=2847045 RepID=A0ABY5ZHV8_9BACT|nr:PTS sugar transporter subunit IIC [Geoalkalibacter halelectricus]MDO3379385.1 PTS sugar transporter subunit IIC [Geoalkalibacter halelectricus]UWZ78737.1 PTS sugar transporter subunit IIC [Geoalkalibacter halelectricus]
MPWSEFFIGALAALVLGLDRTAAGQFMVSRPIVAGPLTGLLIGDPLIGLQVGALVELLWLGRLPVGAAIPPDDTQVAVSGTVLAVAASGRFSVEGTLLILFCVLVAMPLAKVGQIFDRLARNRNGRLIRQAEADLAAGRLRSLERRHLRGLTHFALAGLGTYVLITAPGWAAVLVAGQTLLPTLGKVEGWLLLAFPLVGTATILGTMNVSRSLTLFTASFTTVLLLLWLL